MTDDDDTIAALERKIFSDPLDDESWSVYADLLEANDDPTGALVRRGIAHEDLHGVDLRACLGPLAKLERLDVNWKPRRGYKVHDLWWLPFRGPWISVNLPDIAAQDRFAAALTEHGRKAPRLLVFLQEIDLHVADKLSPALLEALDALPLQQLQFKIVAPKGARYRLDQFPRLLHLDMNDLPLDPELPKAADLPLKSLLIKPKETELDFLADLAHLERLKLDTYRRPDFDLLARCAKLHTVHLSGFGLEPDDLAKIAALPLRHLELSSISNIDLAELEAAKDLEALTISWNDGEDFVLDSLAALPKLRHVSFDQCDGTFDLSPLARVANLAFLEVNECPAAERLYAVQQAHPDLEVEFYIETQE